MSVKDVVADCIRTSKVCSEVLRGHKLSREDWLFTGVRMSLRHSKQLRDRGLYPESPFAELLTEYINELRAAGWDAVAERVAVEFAATK